MIGHLQSKYIWGIDKALSRIRHVSATYAEV